MGHFSGKPTSNDPDISLPDDNPWGTTDDFFHLLNMSAVRCCCCRRVVSKEHVTVISGHAFCPDHKESECQTSDANHHFNVQLFIEQNNTV